MKTLSENKNNSARDWFFHLRTVGNPIGYYPRLAKPLGGVNAVILFSHFLYWHDKTKNALGVYKTAAEIEYETGLSPQEQRTARKKLRERGILIETERRTQHRIYYKLDGKAFAHLMEEFVSENYEDWQLHFPQIVKKIDEKERKNLYKSVSSERVKNQHSRNKESTFANSNINVRIKNKKLQQKTTTETGGSRACAHSRETANAARPSPFFEDKSYLAEQIGGKPPIAGKPPIGGKPPVDQPKTHPRGKKAKGGQKKDFSVVSYLMDLGVAECTARAYLDSLKKHDKGKPDKYTLDEIAEEAENAGASVEEVIKFCAQNGWKRFNSKWDSWQQRHDSNKRVGTKSGSQKTFDDDSSAYLSRRPIDEVLPPPIPPEERVSLKEINAELLAML